jgi:hypothetical protein
MTQPARLPPNPGPEHDWVRAAFGDPSRTNR